MRVKDLPEDDRPRERLLALGPSALAERELLALVLGSGTNGCDAIDLAARLIQRFGSLHELSRADPHELLVDLPGVGPAKAARIAAALELGRRATAPVSRTRVTSSSDLATAAAPLLRGRRKERTIVVVCDSGGHILRTALLTEGSPERTALPIRDVLALVLAAGGTSFGVAHNHPSGRAEPSQQDRKVTGRLAEAADVVGLRFLDHVVLTDTTWRRVEPTD